MHTQRPATPPASPAPIVTLHALSSAILFGNTSCQPISQAPPTPPPTPPRTSGLQSAKHINLKPYMTIDDLYTMFHEKTSKKSLNTIQERMLSSMPRQAHITSYFKPMKQASPKSELFAIGRKVLGTSTWRADLAFIT